MSFEEENLVKSVALSMCFILVVAIMGWTMPLVVAEDKVSPCPLGCGSKEVICPPGCTFPATELTKLANALKGGTAKNFKIEVDEKGGIKMSNGEKATAVTGVVSVEALKKAGLIDAETGLTTIKVKVGNEMVERQIQLTEFPEGLKTIEIGDKGAVTYTMKGASGTLVVDRKGVYMSVVEKKYPILKGVKSSVDVHIEFSDDGEVKVDENGVSYKGKNMGLSVEGKRFRALDDKEGNVKFVGGKDVIIKNTAIDNQKVPPLRDGQDGEYKLIIGENKDGKGIFLGTGNVPEDFKGRSLNFEKGKISGDLTGLGDSEDVTFINYDLGRSISIDKAMLKGTEKDTKIPEGQKAVLNKEDGKGVKSENVNAHVSAFSESETGTRTGTPDRPDLPISPTDQDGKTDGTKDDTKDDEKDDDGDGDGGGGGGGGGDEGGSSKWLMWLLIAGGVAAAIIAAMLLMGGDDDDSAEEDDDDVDDGGEDYMGNDNETDITDEVQEDERTPTVTYNPTLKEKGCTYDEDGYHDCPIDSGAGEEDCSQCDLGSKPLVQSVDDGEDSTDMSGETTEEIIVATTEDTTGITTETV